MPSTAAPPLRRIKEMRQASPSSHLASNRPVPLKTLRQVSTQPMLRHRTSRSPTSLRRQPNPPHPPQLRLPPIPAQAILRRRKSHRQIRLLRLRSRQLRKPKRPRSRSPNRPPSRRSKRRVRRNQYAARPRRLVSGESQPPWRRSQLLCGLSRPTNGPMPPRRRKPYGAS